MSDVRKDVAELKDRIRQEISELKQEAATSLRNTRDDAKTEIQAVRKVASTEAIEETQRRVDEAFKKTNVSALIESAAKRHVGEAVNTQVRNEVDQAFSSLQEEITTLGLISDSGVRMRMGWRIGFQELDSLRTFLPSKRDRDRAGLFLEKITHDYEQSANNMVREFGFKSALEAIQVFNLKNDSALASNLTSLVRTSKNMDDIALAFLSLRQASGRHFRMFDFQEVERWAKEKAK